MKLISALALSACATTALAFAPVAPQRHSSALHMSVVLNKETGKAALDPAVISKYGSLPFPKDKVLAEYVWVDAEGNTRSKTRTLPAAKVCNILPRIDRHYAFEISSYVPTWS